MNANGDSIEVRCSRAGDGHLAQAASDLIHAAAAEHDIAERDVEFLGRKLEAGRAAVALRSDGTLVGFGYWSEWEEGRFLSHSGLVVHSDCRGMGVGRRVKEVIFETSSRQFPAAALMSLTSSPAVQALNESLGLERVPLSELTSDPEFWKGCETCRNYAEVQARGEKCCCIGMLQPRIGPPSDEQEFGASTMKTVEEGIWAIDSGRPGRSVCVSFGVHGNERPPIDAGLELVEAFRQGSLELQAGQVALGAREPARQSAGSTLVGGWCGLERCFSRELLARTPKLYEERRAQTIVSAIEAHGCEVLGDFHCTVEPGPRFLMQHPPIAHAPSAEVYALFAAEVMLADPNLNFGSVSLDEYMSTRDRVGICYETGWIEDPANTPAFVRGEMENMLRGLGLLAGEAQRHPDKDLLQLDEVVACAAEGFRWCEGIGQNLQRLEEGTLLGSYGNGDEVRLPFDATLVFPKKKPEMVQLGKPLVYLGRAM